MADRQRFSSTTGRSEQASQTVQTIMKTVFIGRRGGDEVSEEIGATTAAGNEEPIDLRMQLHDFETWPQTAPSLIVDILSSSQHISRISLKCGECKFESKWALYSYVLHRRKG